MNDFNDAYGKYDPLTDYYGGFPKRYPPYTTKPLGHYNKLLELQQGLNNDIAEYNRLHCDEDDDDGPGFGQVPWQALVDATRIIDIPHPWTSASQTATPSPSNAATDAAAGGLLLLILGAILNPN